VVAITRRERLDPHFVAIVLSEFPVTKRCAVVQCEKGIPRRRNVKTLIADHVGVQAGIALNA
jgi:hypothetical protein